MILGIAGLAGSGKGTVVDYLVRNKGFAHFSIREFLSKELKRRGLPINRDTLAEMGNEIRATHGPEYISNQLLAQASGKYDNIIIESVRSSVDAQNLKNKGAKIWVVDANIHERYRRISVRGTATDHVSFDTFVQKRNESHRMLIRPK